MNKKISIWASLLGGDFGRLEESACRAQDAGADALHIDVMDGNFVPNISMGRDVVKMARRCVNIPLNVHLMMIRPDLHVESFVEAGADALSIHVESRCDISNTLALIKNMGVRQGIVLNPETPAQSAYPFLSETEAVLCMTVHPGFGGQKFMPGVLPKIAEIRKKTGKTRPDLTISVDGGIDLNTASAVAEAGADSLVSGNALFKSADMAGNIALMREKAGKAFHG